MHGAKALALKEGRVSSICFHAGELVGTLSTLSMDLFDLCQVIKIVINFHLNMLFNLEIIGKCLRTFAGLDSPSTFS